MRSKGIATVSVVVALALVPAGRVAADGGDFAAGIITGIIGSAVVNDVKRKNQAKQTYRTTSKSSGVSSAQREQNRQVQTALNYFSFPVGTPDGSIGPRSRAAISQYQGYMGYPATGQLTEYERDFLLNAFYRAQSGGSATAQAIARNPQGVRGLLIAYRDEQMGGGAVMAGSYGGLPPEVSAAVDEIAANSSVSAEQLIQRAGFIQLADMNADGRTDYLLDTAYSGSGFWCNAQSCMVRVFASTPQGYQRNDFQATQPTPAMFTCQQGACQMTGAAAGVLAAAPSVAPQSGTVLVAEPVQPAPITAAPAMPSFLGADGVQPVLSVECERLAPQMAQGGGVTQAAAGADPNLALTEQLCLARGIAISESDALAAKVPGFTAEQIAQQCMGFGPILKDYVAALAEQPQAQVMERVSGFTLASGMAPDQLAGTARICLGVGYAADDMDLAIGSSLVLSALGETGYAELPAHHLSQGFGAPRRPNLSMDWYDAALAAPVAVFGAAGSDRLEVIRKAAYTLGGRAQAPASAVVPAKLPTFALGASEAPAGTAGAP